MKVKEIKNIKVNYDQFTDIEFIPPGTFYILNALGEYHFVCTSSRIEAQKFIDSIYSPGRYTVVCVKLQKSKGELTVTGTHCRKGQRK
jgi:hypothetical protein